MEPAPLDQVVATLVSILLSAYGVRHIYNRGFYNKPQAWMVTILTFHASPALALRLVAPRIHNVTLRSSLPWLWVLLATSLRRRHAVSPFSLVVSTLEVTCVLVPLTNRLLMAAHALNIIILPGFWIACFASSFSNNITFVPLDRHMRKGILHMWRSEDAHHSLLSNVLLHGAVQICSALALGDGDIRAGLRDALLALMVYWAFVCAVTFVIGCSRPYPIPAKSGLLLVATYGLAEGIARGYLDGV
mmetsp:Transcript_56806/g.158170  ORF Transcript_56806/g.158170 Transcript_56806/m.158170 type:complete len:246 (-) Transcript_56806:25-762(-)